MEFPLRWETMEFYVILENPANLIVETWGDSGDLTIEIDAEEYEFEDSLKGKTGRIR